jgi:hypothetical protein
MAERTKNDVVDGMSAEPPRLSSTLVFASGALASLLIGLASLTYPFGHDQAIYAHIGASVLEGDVLYRDIFSLKPPFTAAVHALAQILFGHTMTAIRIFDLLWMGLNCALIAVLVFRIFPGRRFVSILAAFFLAHFYYTFDHWQIAQSDGWANLPLSFAMFLIIRGYGPANGKTSSRRETACWAGAAASIGCALMFKYTFVGFIPILFLALAILNRKKPRRAVWTGASALAGLLFFFGALASLFGGWGALVAYVESQISNISIYASLGAKWQSSGTVTKLLNFQGALFMLDKAPVTFYLGLFGLALCLFRLPGWAKAEFWKAGCVALVIGWLAAAWASTAVQARFHGYHFLPLLPPLAIFAAIFLEDLLEKIYGNLKVRWRRLATGFVLGGILLLPTRGHRDFEMVSHLRQYGYVYSLLDQGKNIEAGWDHRIFAHYANFSIRNTINILRFVDERVSRSDSLFVWGTNAALYFLSGRPRVSNIYSQVQVTGGFGDGSVVELLEELRSNKPEIFLVQRGDAIPFVLRHYKDSKAMLNETTEIRAFVEQNYRHEGRHFNFEVYFLNE